MNRTPLQEIFEKIFLIIFTKFDVFAKCIEDSNVINFKYKNKKYSIFIIEYQERNENNNEE